ncbi:MAG: class I SAM-dependent RNA methyltransferase, partial [Acidimicrobiales bacterium]
MRLVLGQQVVGGGAVLARDGDGRVVFVDGALPGETVEVGPLDRHGDFARGQAEAIVDPSPHRVAPPCPHATAGCGGCQWQHVDPAAQVELKELIVSDALRRIAGPAADGVVRLDAIRLPDSGYRTTGRLAADGTGRLAYRRRRSRQLLSVDECHVAHPRLAELIACVHVTGWREVTLRVGVAGGERLAVPSGPVGGSRRRVE